ncbi:DUF6325 family protein [Microbacterium sp. MYb62]|uniref:DUF6325 family protein n=1 Tax=Microbacterium sp. MYb62 TaxID=1848690 RepID=UPI000CFCE09A|nr:DUF6325 family protein [Microbacterium sp. MYb62]PRB19212.1 hypothetical protein CQ042_02070 [Microbacterium sp. MYb62]
MAEVVDVTLQALGDVEFVVVRLEDDRLSPNILEALLRQVESGAIRLLDFLIVQRLGDEEYRVIEVDHDEFTLAGLGLDTPGLVCEDDARHFASGLPIGSLAAVILVEPTWGERFSRDVDRRGDRILATQPIPAAIANAVLASALQQS